MADTTNVFSDTQEMNVKAENQGQMVVLGMHRSGTSCLTACLASCGAEVGFNADLTGVSEQNPKGFWERRDVRFFCDTLLHLSDADWWKLSSFDLDDITSETRSEARPHLQSAVNQLDRNRPWVIKEPRLCLLLPEFRRYVSSPTCVFIIRNPLEVAHSLQARNGFPLYQGIALWEYYNRKVIEHVQDLPVVLVDHSDLFESPETTVTAIVSELTSLGVEGLVTPPPGTLEDLVDEKLRHYSLSGGEEWSFLSESQQSLWRLLKSGWPIGVEDLGPLAKSTLIALEELEWVKNLSDQSAELSSAKQELKEAQAQLGSLETLVGPLSGRLSNIEKSLEPDAMQSLLRPLMDKVSDLKGLLLDDVENARESAGAQLLEIRKLQEKVDTSAENTKRIRELEQVLAAREVLLSEVTEQLGERQVELDEKALQLQRLENDISEAQAGEQEALSKLRAELSSAQSGNKNLLKKHQQSASSADQNEKERDQLKLQLTSMKQSRSWRITRSLRRLASFQRLLIWFLPKIARHPGRTYLLYRDYRLIADSDFFDPEYYLANNPDVGESGQDPLLHFLRHGASEERNPSPSFSIRGYLRNNADVSTADRNPLAHYLESGRSEGREAVPVSKQQAKPPVPSRNTRRPLEKAKIDVLRLPIDLGSTQSGQAKDFARNAISVDVVIPIHNALSDVTACLESVLKNTEQPFHLFLVNDGSDQRTSAFLAAFAQENSACCSLIENEEAQGFTRAANAGLRKTNADYVVLLNSDTVVPSRWLDRLLECGESNASIGVIGPLSNAASYQSVPELRDGKDWAVNELPEGMNVDGMAEVVTRISGRRFPRVSFINGFCYAIKRSVIEKIGVLDEENFPRGYGEENDYSIRVREAGFELAIADNLYVFHAKSKSYSHETRRELAKVGRDALNSKHGSDRVVDDIVLNERQSAALDATRLMLKMVAAEQTRRATVDVLNDPQISVLYLLMGEGGGGGGHSVVQEAAGLKSLGVKVAVAAYASTRDRNLKIYSAFDPELFFFFEHEIDLIHQAAGFTVVVATHFKTVETLGRVYAANPHILPAYYVQDYEPWIVSEKQTRLKRQAEASYTEIANLLRFAKTDWIRETVFQHHSVQVEKVIPSLDTDVYNTSVISREREDRIHITAMVRASSARRSPAETMDLLKMIASAFGARVRISIFGTDPESHFFSSVATDFELENYGVLIREEVATLIGSAHIFIDLSTYQAFGRTGLESMAVGCVPILPRSGGVGEYAIDGVNARVVNTLDLQETYAAVAELVEDSERLQTLSEAGLKTAARYAIGPAALSELFLFQQHYLARMVSVVVPVHNAFEEVSSCIASVVTHTEGPYELILIDDGSTDERVWPMLQQQAKQHSFVRVIRNAGNLGYTYSINVGCGESNYDVVLLNSDTIVTPRWLNKLRAAAKGRKYVATVTPLSNAAGAFSVPRNNTVNSLPDGYSVELMGELVEDVSESLLPEVPTGNGFCMYITRQALQELGGFDQENFPRGYGEENDFCMRAAEAGFVNLIEDNTFIFHHRSASFGDQKKALAEAGAEALRRLHPSYKSKVQNWLSNDPLDSMRNRLSEAIDIGQQQVETGGRSRRSLLYILHNGSGGTLHTTLDLLGKLSKADDCFVLRTDIDSWLFSRCVDGKFVDTKTIPFQKSWLINQNLDSERRTALRRLLDTAKPDLVHIRHMIGNHPEIVDRLKSEFSLPVIVSIHDVYSVCPTIQLFDDNQSYCGGYCTASNGECRVSKKWFRKMPPLKHAYVHDWRETVGPSLARADALVVTSHTTMEMIRRHHPFIRRELFQLIPHGRDREAYRNAFQPVSGNRMKVVYFGALGPGKGTHFVHEMLKLNNQRGLPIELHILGDSNLPFDPDQFSVVHHGRYEREELSRFLEEIGPSVSILPSIGPETYCHALTEAWACGIPVLGSSLGAVGERLQDGGGWILDPTDPSEWLNKLEAIAADPAALAEQHRLISQISLPTVADMASSYLELYQRVLSKHRTGHSFSTPG